ncbi:MAG: hypothetical protein HZB71_05510 [Betaproteobacteria bacterium]|nr:hypothetical protein [Betaproteobacteria bacterium]
MKRLFRLIRPAVEEVSGMVHPRQKEIERAVLRTLAKSGMDGHVRLWPDPFLENRKPALLINVDRVNRRFSQVALGMLGEHCITYVQLHFELDLEGVFWSIHPEADMAKELSSCGPTIIGYLVEETGELLASEVHKPVSRLGSAVMNAA